jgi:putative membrane protein
MSGDSFDKAYMNAMVSDHQEDISEFQKEADRGRDPDFKSFAGKTLPTLQEHLRMAKDAATAVGAKQ